MMVKTRMRIRFPCGYEYELETATGVLDIHMTSIQSIEKEMPKECPIHKKNCPPKKIK
jgi:hypothetical protein